MLRSSVSGIKCIGTYQHPSKRSEDTAAAVFVDKPGIQMPKKMEVVRAYDHVTVVSVEVGQRHISKVRI